MMKKRIPKEDIRMQIIGAAAKLFAEQGFQQTTISEIAKSVGLAEGSIYDHFKGKEDLLLTIPDLWVSRAIEELEVQMLGVEGAFNKLRKFLWWYAYYIQSEPMTANVVFLFLKTNQNFIDTNVYPNVKTFYGSLIKIFEEGRESGEMAEDLDPYVARMIVLGTIEHMVIRWLLKGRTYSLFDNLEMIYQSLMRGFRRPPED